MRPVPGEALGLNRAQMRPSEYANALERIVEEQRAVIDCLKGVMGPDHPALPLVKSRAWMVDLPRQERAVAAALLAASPQALSFWALLDLTPGRDHVEDRQPQLVKVIVSKLRRKLGAGAILTLHGEGYFMPSAERARLLSLS